MLFKIVTMILELLLRFGLKKKKEVDTERISTLESTIQSMNESLEVEKEIRDKQSSISKNPVDVESSDGGLDFNNFNNGN
jgi:hypothetical protein